MPAKCECETTEYPDEAACEKLLSISAETREKSDSDMAGSLGGKSRSELSPGPGDMGCEGLSASNGSPTKHIRVLISSMTLSVSTSWGTRVERVAAGIFMVALRDVAGGM